MPFPPSFQKGVRVLIVLRFGQSFEKPKNDIPSSHGSSTISAHAPQELRRQMLDSTLNRDVKISQEIGESVTLANKGQNTIIEW
ncbi:hypothetical protein CCMA1212_007261 [Trichoderma ghanense]|uniref:Uncharacterized protein n=1 Tax=Trichoderma ghanense TaxID=65468 RepID=A0ABY2GYH9_9HYPO